MCDLPGAWLSRLCERWKWTALAFDWLIQRPRRWYYHRRWRLTRGPTSLNRYEFQQYSQNGEDGILHELFHRIGSTNNFVLEFGIQDGRECLARALVTHAGWKALLLEGSSTDAEAAKELYLRWPVRVGQCFLTAENILDVLSDYRVPAQPDLLVVDIDGNDYWIWRQILSAYRPRVAVIEYNARWVPPCEWVMPYNPTHTWDDSAYFGASLQALVRLAQQHDYELVACDSRGVNAFFVEGPVARAHLPNEIGNAAFHYAPPQYTRGFGHPIYRRARPSEALTSSPV